MINSFCVKLAELETLSDEFSKRRRLIENCKQKLKFAIRNDDLSKASVYSHLIGLCESLSDEYNQGRELVLHMKVEGEHLASEFVGQLADAYDRLCKIDFTLEPYIK